MDSSLNNNKVEKVNEIETNEFQTKNESNKDFTISIVIMLFLLPFYILLFVENFTTNWGNHSLWPYMVQYFAEMIITPVIRTTAFIKDQKQKKKTIIFNLIYSISIFLFFTIAIIAQSISRDENIRFFLDGWTYIVGFCMALLVSIPLNVILLIKKQNFKEYSGFYHRKENEHNGVRILKIIRTIITLILLILLSNILLSGKDSFITDNISFDSQVYEYFPFILLGIMLAWYILSEIIITIASKISMKKTIQ
ncbi:MAG: hypothetical protein ACTSXA_05850 [Candidatus Heimdallarchaeota archaeon]